MRTINRTIVHCSDTPATMDIGVKEIDQWHKERGWKGIGYHYVIRRDGTIEFGRDLDQMGAHTKGHNSDSVGVCLVGGWKGEFNFTIAQLMSLKNLVNILQKEVFGHRDFDPSKTCPCFNVKALLA